MNRGFWKKLNKPFFALAPMYDVTDEAFRFVIAKYGKPDIFWTEFVSAEGLANEVGFERLKHQLEFSAIEKPIVAQIFGKDPEAYKKTAKLIEKMGYDGIDINMGCPDKNIMKQGSCAALFKNPDLAVELINAAKLGAPTLPVSVKIRIGDTKIDWQNWILKLLTAEPAAITVHLRTRKEMSKVDAHWELMPEIVNFIQEHTTEYNRPLILGNGDVKNIQEARNKVTETGADGVMLGRAIFGNPWLFSEKIPSVKERMDVMLEHTFLYEKKYAGIKSFELMKKHFKAYVTDFGSAKELRTKLFTAKNASEVKAIVDNHKF
jgi:nifR3 family TIM-barrel protein